MAEAAQGSYAIRVPKGRSKMGALPGQQGIQPVSQDELAGTYITAVPAMPDKDSRQVEFLGIQPPYSFARVSYNERTKEYLYEVIEPQLSPNERTILKQLKETLSKLLGSEGTTMSTSDKRAYLRQTVENYLQTRSMNLSPLSLERINYYIVRDFVGYGPIDGLIADEALEDISCDGVDIPLFVFHTRYESVKCSVKFDDEDQLNSFIVSLGQRCGKQVSRSSPILDGTTPEGHRVQATYSREITTRGASFTIRRFKEKPWTPVDLIKAGTASPEMVAYLWLSAELGWSMIICGGPASGKTSTLNAAALFIPPTAKIVSLEDTRELNLPHENWIPGVTRSGTGDRGPDGKAAGEVDMFDLVRAALRQRPNYIIVGEVRGKETYTMFQAMATGHTTYSTMHADSVKSMVNRLENPPINTPRILLAALNVVLIQFQARVGNSNVRRLRQILEIVGFEPETNELITNTVYEWDPSKDTFTFKGHSFLFDTLTELKNLTHEEMESEFKRRVAVVKYMVDQNWSDYRQIWKIVTSYYREPGEVMTKIGYVPDGGSS